jgi:iron complex outermembrane receptor protein
LNKDLYHIKFLAFLLICFCCFDNAKAQDIGKDTLSIKEVSVSAPRKKDEVALIKSRVDTNVLKNYQSESLAEILSSNSPVFVKSEGRGALSTVSFRGTAASHTDVVWNGLSLKSPMFGEVDFSLIPLFLVDDVSLLHGGTSISSGSGALGGTVSLDNKVDWKNKKSIKFQQNIGSFSTIADYLQVKLGNKKLQSNTRVLYSYSKNNYPFLNKSNAEIDPVTGEKTYSIERKTNADYLQYGLLQELYYRFASRYTASIKYWGHFSDRGLPRVNTYEGDENSNISDSKDISHRLVANLKRFGEKSKFEFNAGYIDKDMRFLMQNYSKGNGYITNIYSRSRSKSSISKINYEYQLFSKTQVALSYQLNYHDVFTRDTIKNEGYDKQRFDHDIAINLRQKITDRLSSILIVRQQAIGNDFTPITPFLGVDYRLSDKYKSFAKFSVSKNYKQPTLNELYWQPGGNPNLLPEEAFSTDLSIESTIKKGDMSVYGRLGGYYSKIENWILWIPSTMAYWSPYNVREVESKGIEIYLKGNIKVGKVNLNTSMNYAYTSSLNLDQSWGDDVYRKQLVFVPEHSYNLFMQLEWKRFYINYQHNSFGERYTTSTNQTNSRDWLYPYFMNDLKVGKAFKVKKLDVDVNLKVFNLFDETYRSVLQTMMPGRHYLVSLSIKI